MPHPAHAFGLAFVLATVLVLPAAATADGGFVFSRTLAGQRVMSPISEAASR